MVTRFRVLTLALVVLASAGCQTEPEPRGSNILVGWRPLVSFAGHGDSQTESFSVESGQWRIKWVTSDEKPPGTGTFKVTVHSAVSGRPITVAADHKGDGHGVAYVNEDPRLYHLVIESRNVDWSVAIEEEVTGYAGK